MTREEFEECVSQAIAHLPPGIRRRLANLDFVIEEEPRAPAAPEHVISRGGILLGLYQGTPLDRRMTQYAFALPDKITLFQSAIEFVGGQDDGRVRQLIEETVRHEVAHHIGFDEKQVRNLEGRPHSGH